MVVAGMLAGTQVGLGAQNLHWEESGAFTGEVSPLMIKEFCQYVIIGHSERRQYFGETDETVNKKIKAALKQGLKVILCIGESLEQRESGQTFQVLEEELKKGLFEIKSDGIESIVIAYEPIWAIGTGKTATPEIAEEAHKFIRDYISKIFNKDIGEKIRILYGGSVKPTNISDLMDMEDIDGALVGGASLDPDTFAEIVQFK